MLTLPSQLRLEKKLQATTHPAGICAEGNGSYLQVHQGVSFPKPKWKTLVAHSFCYSPSFYLSRGWKYLLEQQCQLCQPCFCSGCNPAPQCLCCAGRGNCFGISQMAEMLVFPNGSSAAGGMEGSSLILDSV